jgi:hypothetical protein
LSVCARLRLATSAGVEPSLRIGFNTRLLRDPQPRT